MAHIVDLSGGSTEGHKLEEPEESRRDRRCPL